MNRVVISAGGYSLSAAPESILIKTIVTSYNENIPEDDPYITVRFKTEGMTIKVRIEYLMDGKIERTWGNDEQKEEGKIIIYTRDLPVSFRTISEHEGGYFRLVFDNSFSYNNSKTVQYELVTASI